MFRVAALAAVLLVTSQGASAAQDSIAAARDLYMTAGYDEALAMLTRLRADTTEPAQVRTIDQYRVFALFAVGQTAEAERVVEGMTLLDPLWVLPKGEAPPRIESLFAAARARALPGVVRQRLGAARVLYAEKRYAAASEAFTGVLTLLEDPAVSQAVGADAVTVSAIATGFRDLAVAADEQARAAALRAGPAPAGAAPQTATAVQGDPPIVPETPAPVGGAESGRAPAATPESEAPAAPAPSEPAATPAVTQIVPPVVIAQLIPRPSDVSIPMGSPQTILMDIVIDENGRVERAEIKKSVDRLYESQLIAATRGWRYKPATQGGRPTKYLRTLEITLNPRR